MMMPQIHQQREHFSFIFAPANARFVDITKQKVISFVMENRFNSRKYENALSPMLRTITTHRNAIGTPGKVY